MKIVAFATILAVCASTSVAALAQDAERYRLGIQDRLRVHVHEWPVLNGEFVVGANGALVLPFVGNVMAKGLDPSELADEIGRRLKERAQLSIAPATTVEVAQYRPFYILGGVERPGEYNYRPSMMVVNAVAIAGGVYRPPRSSELNYERDAITGRGELRIAVVRRDELRAREFRLRAEAEGLETFPPVPANMPPGTMAFIAQERQLFATRLERFRNQYDAIGNSIALLEEEIRSLEGQIAAAEKQEHSVARELEDTKGLVARSVLPAPRILPIERTLAQIEREKKEIGTAILRARQQINTLTSQRDTLQDERRSTALAELQSVEAQIKEHEERADTASRLIANANATQLEASESDDSEAAISYVIIRQMDEKVIELKATETTPVHPGDIIKVHRPKETDTSRPRWMR